MAIDTDLVHLDGSKDKWNESGRGYLMYTSKNNCFKNFKPEGGFPKACGLRKDNAGGNIKVIEMKAPGAGIDEKQIEDLFRFRPSS